MVLGLYLTLVEVALGLALIQCFIPRSALGAGFGKTIAAIVFLCLLGPVVLAGQMLPPRAGIVSIRVWGAAALAGWFVYFVSLGRPRAPGATAAATLGTAALALMAGLSGRLVAEHYSAAARAQGQDLGAGALMASLLPGVATSALLLGSVTMAMLIGHWYLVNPGLPIRWLKGACLLFGAAIGLRLVAIGVTMIVGMLTDPYGMRNFLDELRLGATPLFLTVRGLVGLALPAGFCAMAYRSAALRATQSSTGILFPAMIVVFIGEMIAASLVTGLSGLNV